MSKTWNRQNIDIPAELAPDMPGFLNQFVMMRSELSGTDQRNRPLVSVKWSLPVCLIRELIRQTLRYPTFFAVLLAAIDDEIWHHKSYRV